MYSLAPDPKNLTKIGAANLRVGQTKTFPNGVSVTFDGWKPWVSLQVSHDPTQGFLLLSARRHGDRPRPVAGRTPPAAVDPGPRATMGRRLPW